MKYTQKGRKTIDATSGVPGDEASVSVIGGGPVDWNGGGLTNDGSSPNPSGRLQPAPVHLRRSSDQRQINVATWNVRTLQQLGKLERDLNVTG